MRHAFSVDVEDAINLISRQLLGIDKIPTDRVVGNTHRLLEMLAQQNVQATFFVLGEVAETFPALIRDIAAGDHELGVHGYYHHQIFKLTPEAFRKEVADAKSRIEDISGKQVKGHRAPAFSVMPGTLWALDVLAEEGFAYDSSIVPCRNKRYGYLGFPEDVCRVELPSGRGIVEAPMSTVRVPVLGKGLLIGGGYLKYFPFAVTRWAFDTVQTRRPVILYLHPYEIDAAPIPIKTDHLSLRGKLRVARFRRMAMYNKKGVPAKLRRLLERYPFTTVEEIIRLREQAGELPTVRLSESDTNGSSPASAEPAGAAFPTRTGEPEK